MRKYPYNKKEKWIIEEVKEMKPYVEVKVVKVKKNCKKEYVGEICIRGKRRPLYAKGHYIYFEGKEEGKKVYKEYGVNKHLKGNWINGENLDKIKFPCYCKFDSNKGINGSGSGQCVKGIGKIDKTYTAEETQYQISWADRQVEGLSVLCTTPSLKRLFEIYRPKILKAKLILFEEE